MVVVTICIVVLHFFVVILYLSVVVLCLFVVILHLFVVVLRLCRQFVSLWLFCVSSQSPSWDIDHFHSSFLQFVQFKAQQQQPCIKQHLCHASVFSFFMKLCRGVDVGGVQYRLVS